MADRNALTARNRFHIVLVPGFGGFDALGQVEYYSGVTDLYRNWRRTNPEFPVVLHYFDNLPTAAVSTRAERLRRYLAKRIDRGEILEDDRVVLVGHSTGGLDIRQLVLDLHRGERKPVHSDGGFTVPDQAIRNCLDGVVFLSVPHWGTNVADWVHSQTLLRTAVIAKLSAVVAGAQLPLLDTIENQITRTTAALTDADMVLAFGDALTEANDHYGKPGPSRTVSAQETASDLALYLRHITSDFRAIDDLTSRLYDPRKKTPAHLSETEREDELQLWRDPAIRTLSYATVGGRAFRFPAGALAPAWDLINPFSYPEIAKDLELSAGTDLSYRFCYRACAGGPFRWPKQAGEVSRTLGPPPPDPLEVWDNDGIVNTASMLWPEGEIVLVLADHLDIVGHYHLVKSPAETENGRTYPPARRYLSYDSLKSMPRFTGQTFQEIWTEIFDFACNRKAGQEEHVESPAAALAGAPAR